MAFERYRLLSLIGQGGMGKVIAMAAAAAAIYLALNLWHPVANGTTIDASYYVDNHAALAAGAPFSENAPLPAVLTSDDETR